MHNPRRTITRTTRGRTSARDLRAALEALRADDRRLELVAVADAGRVIVAAPGACIHCGGTGVRCCEFAAAR